MNEISITGNSIKIFHRRRKQIFFKQKGGELINEIRKNEIVKRSKELQTYLNELDKLNEELKKITHELKRIKSLNKIAAVKQEILRRSCDFETCATPPDLFKKN